MKKIAKVSQGNRQSGCCCPSDGGSFIGGIIVCILLLAMIGSCS